MYDFQFTTTARKLSDGSTVHDVLMSIEGEEHSHALPAISAGDAYKLMTKLTEAINEHTNLEARTA